jgi:uncharacterized membrane protein
MPIEPASLTRWQTPAWGVAVAAWISLTLLTAAWEISLAPIRPGGSWLALKAIPLLLALPGIVRARAYTLQWATLLVQLYLLEGLVRVFESGPVRVLATVEIILASVFFIAAVAYLYPLKKAARQRAAAR